MAKTGHGEHPVPLRGVHSAWPTIPLATRLSCSGAGCPATVLTTASAVKPGSIDDPDRSGPSARELVDRSVVGAHPIDELRICRDPRHVVLAGRKKTWRRITGLRHRE